MALKVIKFFWLQNRFLVNSLDQTIFLRKCFWSKFFLVAKSFPQKQFEWKFFENILLLENFFVCKIISLETVWMKRSLRKIFWSKIFWSKNFLVEKFLWLKMFLVAKSFPWKQFGWKKNLRIYFGQKCFWSKNALVEIFFGCEVNSSETV